MLYVRALEPESIDAGLLFFGEEKTIMMWVDEGLEVSRTCTVYFRVSVKEEKKRTPCTRLGWFGGLEPRRWWMEGRFIYAEWGGIYIYVFLGF
jgi:hypothetical protein